MVQCDVTGAVTMATHFIGTYRTNVFNETVCKEPNLHTQTIGSTNKSVHVIPQYETGKLTHICMSKVGYLD